MALGQHAVRRHDTVREVVVQPGAVLVLAPSEQLEAQQPGSLPPGPAITHWAEVGNEQLALTTAAVLLLFVAVAEIAVVAVTVVAVTVALFAGRRRRRAAEPVDGGALPLVGL